MKIIKNFIKLYNDSGIAVVSAALAFYITLTFFPLQICLYTLLGGNGDMLKRILDFTSNFLAEDTVRLVEDFVEYVASNNSPAMLFAGIIVMTTFASAAVRILQGYIGKMQGGTRYKGILYYLFSILFSLIFLGAMYFAVIVMMTGKNFVSAVNKYIPFADISSSWSSIRFYLLGFIFFLMIFGIYELSKRKTDSYPTFIGSLITTASFVFVCILFSMFISKSARYSLVYGSLTSVILLMLWLYYCCMVICSGAAFNIAVRDAREEKHQRVIQKIIEEERQKYRN